MTVHWPNGQFISGNYGNTDDTEFHVVPLVIGAGGNSGMMQIIIGAALIAAVVLTLWTMIVYLVKAWPVILKNE